MPRWATRAVRLSTASRMFQPTPTYDSVGDPGLLGWQMGFHVFQPTPTYDSVGDLRQYAMAAEAIFAFQPTPTYDSVGDEMDRGSARDDEVSTHAHL